MRFELVQIESETDALVNAWRKLYNAHPTASVFQGPDWVLSLLGPAKMSRLLLLCGFRGKELVATWPFFRRRFPVECLNLVGSGLTGTGPSDHLDPLVLPGEHFNFEGATHCLREQLPGGLILLNEVTYAQYDEFESSCSSECFLLDLNTCWQEYMRTLSPNIRRDMQLRGGDEIHRPTDTLQAFETFRGLHRHRWNRRLQLGAFAMPGLVQFHKRWLNRAAETGEAEFLELRTSCPQQETHAVIGSLYLLRHNQWIGFYQSGFRPGIQGKSPGTLLIGAAIQEAFEYGAAVFDFLRGAEAYKERWNPTRKILQYEAWSVGNTPARQSMNELLKRRQGVSNWIRCKLEPPRGGTKKKLV